MESAMNAMRKLSIHRIRMVPSTLVYHLVPEILEELTSFVLKHVDVEGLFRINGSIERVRVLQERLQKGEQVPEDQPVQDVCSVLKRWLRKQTLFAKCIRPKSPPEHMDELRPTLAEMAPQNVLILQHVCRFLQIVAQNSLTNRMDIDNLAGIVGESVFFVGVDESRAKMAEAPTADALRGHTEVVKQSMKLLIENVGVIAALGDNLFRTPERAARAGGESGAQKRSFTTRMKHYGSALKNLTVKRSRSLSLDSKPEFAAPELFGCDERVQLRERKGTMAQNANELLQRRSKAIARIAIERRASRSRRTSGHRPGAPVVLGHSPRAGKENATPIGPNETLRGDNGLDEPQQLEWKPLPRDIPASFDTSSSRGVRCR